MKKVKPNVSLTELLPVHLVFTLRLLLSFKGPRLWRTLGWRCSDTSRGSCHTDTPSTITRSTSKRTNTAAKTAAATTTQINSSQNILTNWIHFIEENLSKLLSKKWFGGRQFAGYGFRSNPKLNSSDHPLFQRMVLTATVEWRQANFQAYAAKFCCWA